MTIAKFLEISQVGKSYGPQVIVDDFNLNVARGEFVSRWWLVWSNRVLERSFSLAKPSTAPVPIAA
jgi:hypothetical protein